MLDYKLIQALAMVVREGGFEKAARALYITQSAVSQRVKLLEEQMGQILLTRTTPPQATAAGRKMLKHYLQVEHLENDLTGDVGLDKENKFSTVAVGINADSLATWLWEAIHPFLSNERILLDIRVDDQEQTHQLLKNGAVIGCISTQEKAMQGCRIAYIGKMNYRMMSTPAFAGQWFPDGISKNAISHAPAVIFNRKDALHLKLLARVLNEVPGLIPTHYVPSAERFADFITSGLGYGMLPDQQSEPLITAGLISDLAPGFEVPVQLYWHCWNLKSTLLDRLSQHLIRQGKKLLQR